MLLTNIKMGYIIIFGVAIIGLVLFSLWSKRAADQFKPKRLLTKNEEEFFGRILCGLPDFHVFPQVAIRAFVRPGAAAGNKSYYRQLGRIGAKHCDFLVCNKQLDIVAIIELDDRTHDQEKDAARDAMTHSAGYHTLRYETRQKPTAPQIREDLTRLLSTQKSG